MKRLKAISATLGALLVLAIAPAWGDHHRPPKTSLFFKGERRQAGNLITFCWSNPDQGSAMCADGFPNYPDKPVVVPDNSRLKIRMHRKERPSKRWLYAYFDIDENGYPQGESKRLHTKLTRVWRDGKVVAWDAHFTVWRKDAHYYISLETEWFQGDAYYDFHVRTEE